MTLLMKTRRVRVIRRIIRVRILTLINSGACTRKLIGKLLMMMLLLKLNRLNRLKRILIILLNLQLNITMGTRRIS